MATVSVPDVAANASVPLLKEVVMPQLDLTARSLYAPIYKWRRLIQVSGGTGQTLSSGVSNSIFNIPGGGVYNLSRSYLTFDVSFAVPAAANALNTIFCDQVPMNDITLQTQTGQIVANLINIPIYSKTANFLTTSMSDYLTRESVLHYDTVANAFGTINQFCQPAKLAYFVPALTTHTGVLNWQATVPAATELKTGAGAVTPGALTSVAAIGLALTSGALTSNTITNQYVIKAGTVSIVPMGASGINDPNAPQRLATGANAASVMRCKVPLSYFIGTVLAMDRNIYWGGQNMQLNINWSPLNKWGYSSQLNNATNLTDLITGAFTNYYLYLAQEVCAPNVEQAMANTASGQPLLVPYTLCPKLNFGAAGMQTMNTPLVQGYGILKRILTVIVNGTDSGRLSSNSDNVLATLTDAGTDSYYRNVQSFLNNSPLQDYVLRPFYKEDYNYIWNLIKDSPAGISARNYYINPFWVDNFSDSSRSVEWRENDCMDSGREITNSENYAITYELVATAASCYQFCTFGRRLVISNSAIQWA